MGRRLFDFQCKAGHKHEQMVEADVRTVQCETCGEPAQRLLAAPRCQLEGITGSFPGAAMKWEATRESHMRQERKNMERHGTYK
jgi:hypothetical protein